MFSIDKQKSKIIVEQDEFNASACVFLKHLSVCEDDARPTKSAEKNLSFMNNLSVYNQILPQLQRVNFCSLQSPTFATLTSIENRIPKS